MKDKKYLVTITLVFAGLVCFAFFYKASFKPLDNNPTLLMVFNGEYATEAENSLASIKQNVPELLPNVTICVSDDSARNFAKKHNLRFFELDTIAETGSYLSVPMNRMGQRKIECILHLLRQGEDVFYADTDIVYFKNPASQFNTNYDLNIQADECFGPYKHNYLCTGFMYVKSNPKTIRFFEEDIDKVIESAYKINDQIALDRLVKEQGLLKFYNVFDMSINVLDVCKFPNGCRYFDLSDKNCKREDAWIVHNNHIVGIENKRKRFEEHGFIFE